MALMSHLYYQSLCIQRLSDLSYKHTHTHTRLYSELACPYPNSKTNQGTHKGEESPEVSHILGLYNMIDMISA